MLRVGDEGALESVRVSHPREGVFESAELGLRDFDLLPFRDPTEFSVSLAVADFNGDGLPDAAVQVPFQGLLRFFMGRADGAYDEQLQIETGKGARSIAAADFNGDGFMDVAVSGVGTGVLTFLYGKPNNQFKYQTSWLDVYRDYVLAADPSGTGRPQLVGMDFTNRGVVLKDFAESSLAGTPFEYLPSLNSEVATAKGRSSRINAVVMSSSLALNLDNRMGTMTNIVTVAPGANVYLLVGDVDADGSLTVGIATPRH